MQRPANSLVSPLFVVTLIAAGAACTLHPAIAQTAAASSYDATYAAPAANPPGAAAPPASAPSSGAAANRAASIDAQLAGSPVRFGRFTMRPPRGYPSVKKDNSNGTTHLYGWALDPAADRPAAAITMGDLSIPTDKTLSMTADQLAQSFASSEEKPDHLYN